MERTEQLDRILQAVALQASGNFDEAIALFKNILEMEQHNFVALYSLGAIYFNMGELHESLSFLDRASKINPAFAETYYVRALVYEKLEQFSSALNEINKVIELNPLFQDAKLLKNKISSQIEMQIKNQLPTVKIHLQRGYEFQEQKLYDEAAGEFNKVIELDSENFSAHYSLGVIENLRGEDTAALKHFEKTTEIEPNNALGYFAKGTLLQGVGLFDEALINLDESIRLDPSYIPAYNNKTVILRTLNQHLDAIKNADAALQISPENQDALFHIGHLYTEFKKFDLASQYFSKLLEIEPNYPYALGNRILAQLHSCDWSNYQSDVRMIIEGIKLGKKVINPFALMAISDDVNLALECAIIFGFDKFSESNEQLWKGEQYRHRKLRIALISSDFREHPVGYLFIGLMEALSRENLELTCFYLGHRDESDLYYRYKKAFDNYIDCADKTSREIACLIRSYEIDIAIDLSGYTAGSRLDILAMRPAPIQATYLGFPGTLSLPYIDYLIADKNTVPPELIKYYSETIIHLPKCYLPRDSKITLLESSKDRLNYGLPMVGRIICCFNHDYKITPVVFQVWMEILKEFEDCTLWLMKLNEDAEKNLSKVAMQYGVDPSRIIYASRVQEVEEHLARYKLADLFVDTYPYNGHTTASDCLLTGLPLITIKGQTFASRVASSLLCDYGLDELIADNIEHYKNKIRYYLDPEHNIKIKEKLKTQGAILNGSYKNEERALDFEKALIDISVSKHEERSYTDGLITIFEKIKHQGYESVILQSGPIGWMTCVKGQLRNHNIAYKKHDDGFNQNVIGIIYLNDDDLSTFDEILAVAQKSKLRAVLVAYYGSSENYGFLEKSLAAHNFTVAVKNQPQISTDGIQEIIYFSPSIEISLAEINYYHTYFDSNYLTRAILMLESLMAHDPKAAIHVLCLDKVAYQFLKNYSSQVIPISIEELVEADPEFGDSRNNRTLIEWYFTATAVFTAYIFQKFPEINRSTYLDSDLFFFSSPEILHEEAAGKSVQIIPHNFTPGMESLARYGIFNVGWISFFNSEEGLRIVHDYRKACILWCKDEVEEDRFADQKYLDKWPTSYKNVCISRWKGADVSHWNIAQWEISILDNKFFLDNEVLIFYHFQGIKLQDTKKYGLSGSDANLGIYYEFLYRPYINKMNEKETVLQKYLDGIQRHPIRYINNDKTLSNASEKISFDNLKDRSNSPTIIFVGTCYDAFLNSHYAENQTLFRSPYNTQLESLLATRFGDSDFYSYGIKQCGWQAIDIIANSIEIQTAWANENEFKGGLIEILIEQVRRIMPDVVYFQDISMCTKELLDRVKPLTKIIAGQIASPLSPLTHLAGFDCIFSSFPHFVDRFNQQGVKAYYQPLAFDERVLADFKPINKDIEFSFVGGITGHHSKGTDLLMKVAEKTPLQIWGYGSQFVPDGSLLKVRHHGEAWGHKMFDLLRRSKISLNRHIDTSENYANNMRLFEATGMGALLLTDNKSNLSSLFKVGEELITYDTPEQCIDLANYFIKNTAEASEISRSGQRRTLTDHSYAARMKITAEILAEKLKKK